MTNIRPKTVRISITQDDEGLFHVTSPDVRNLFLADHTREEVIAAAPAAIAELYSAADRFLVMPEDITVVEHDVTP